MSPDAGPGCRAAAETDPTFVPIRGVRLVLLVGVLLIAQILDGMDLNALAFVGSAVSRDLGLSRATFGASIGAGFLGTAIGAALFGAVADRFGRRNTLLIVVSLFSLGSLLISQVSSLTELLVIRVVTGTALGGLVPISSAILIGNVVASARTTAVAIVVTGSAGGAVLAGLVSTFIVPVHGWRSMFVVGGLAPLAILPLLWLIVPRDRAGMPASAAKSMPQAERASLFRGGTWRLTLRLWLGMIIGAVPVFVAVGWIPSLIEANGASPAQAALAASLFSLGGAVGGVVAGNLTDRFGFRTVLPMAFAAGVAAAVLGLAIGGAGSAPAAGVAGFFVVGTLTLMSAVSGQFYPDAIRGLAIGAGLAVVRIGAAIAPWGAGKLLDLGIATSTLFFLCAGAAMIGGLTFASALRLRPATVPD